MTKQLLACLIFTVSPLTLAQEFKVEEITRLIGIDANAVVRLDETVVNFNAIDELEIKERFAITVFNESGLEHAIKRVNYNKSNKVHKYSAIMYDAQGNELKKYKKREIIDRSSVSGIALFEDDRMMYYDIVPIEYPFTIHYEIEKTSSNTAFLPRWVPVLDQHIGIENSTFEFNNHTAINIRFQERFPEAFNIEKQVSEKRNYYELKNQTKIIFEPLSPYFDEILPIVYFAADEFELEGVQGNMKTWEEFGQWMFDNFIDGKQDLTEEDKQNVAKLTSGLSSKKEKVKVLYHYMQEKVRYVLVALGIGGWSPFSANYVGKNSYGDCKALSNYMYSLLKEANIDSNYTVVWSTYKKDFQTDFPVMQGNHVILNVPLENDTIWLENTSQKAPFNFLGDFTDDRKALSVSNQGSKLVKTQKFLPKDNQEIIFGNGTIDASGKLKLLLTDEFTGIQYDHQYNHYFQEKEKQDIYVNDNLMILKELK